MRGCGFFYSRLPACIRSYLLDNIIIIIIINKFIGNSTELDSHIQYIQAYTIQVVGKVRNSIQR